jgi:hypothetical protein
MEMESKADKWRKTYGCGRSGKIDTYIKNLAATAAAGNRLTND